MARRILVTGGAGFVGANLVAALQNQAPDAAITVVDDFRSGTFANLSVEGEPGFSFTGHVIARPLHELDIAGLLDELSPDVIYHQASITDTTVMDEARMIRENVEPFARLLEGAIERQAKLVWASSAATYGTQANGATEARRPFQPGDAGRPANVYGFSKWVMENRHRQLLAAHPSAHVVGLRYFNVFGPGEQQKGAMASMVYQLAQQILQGQQPRIFEHGEQARDQVYVKDVVGATLAAADDGAQPGIYNVGSGQATTFNTIVAKLNEALDTDFAPDYFPNPYPFYQDYTCADLSASEHGLNWRPAYDPGDAIIEYARWLADRL